MRLPVMRREGAAYEGHTVQLDAVPEMWYRYGAGITRLSADPGRPRVTAHSYFREPAVAFFQGGVEGAKELIVAVIPFRFVFVGDERSSLFY
jgi:hypothetical protein